MNEQFENLYELALVMVSKLSWYTEEAREKAYTLIREAQAAVTKKPVTPKKMTTPLPDGVEETPTGKVVKPRKDA
jgi:hypothetical protein